MFAINLIGDPAVLHTLLPHRHETLFTVVRENLAPMPIYLYGAGAGHLRDAAEFGAQRTGRPRHRLADIDLPEGIHLVGDVDLDAGEFVMLLFLGPEPK